MKREILFRGKSVNTGEWIEGDGIHYPKSINYLGTCWIDGMEDRANDWIQVDPATVGQYTGLCDDKERKVFEGDIVDVRGRFKSEVRYVCRNTGFLIKDNYGNWEWLYDVLASMHCEVIGNIHDNPELMEGAGE